MSESFRSTPYDSRLLRSARRPWIAPCLAPHSTLTVLTQAPLPQPLSLLFLQASISQCKDQNGNPVPCP
jgi:hypothetical protein